MENMLIKVNMMNKKYLYTILPLLIGLYSTASFSGNGKVLPGTICKPIESNLDTIHLTRSTLGEMYNNSTEKQYWICPLVRNLKAGGTRLSVNVKVRAIANNLNDMVKCSLNSRIENDFPHLSSSSEAYQNDSSQINNWLLRFDHLVDKDSNGYIYARCLIPGKRRVEGQWVRAGVTSIEYNKYD